MSHSMSFNMTSALRLDVTVATRASMNRNGLWSSVNDIKLSSPPSKCFHLQSKISSAASDAQERTYAYATKTAKNAIFSSALKAFASGFCAAQSHLGLDWLGDEPGEAHKEAAQNTLHSTPEACLRPVKLR